MANRAHMVAPREQFRFALMPALILLAGLAGGHAAAQAPTFVTTEYPLLGNTHVVGDFNGDGSLDLAGPGLQSARVMSNNGAGTFGPKFEFPVGGPAQDLAAGDFNGDGRLDLVVTINDPQIGLSLLTGNGNGTFNAPVNFANAAGFDSPAVVAVDLNADGRLDVVVAHEIACYTAPCVAALTISVMLGNGDGTFQPTRVIEVGRGMTEIAVGDFNRDGARDLAIAGDNARVYRLFGVGDGTFVQQPTLTLINDGTPNIGVDGTDIDVADFNGDTIQDLVVALGLNGSRTAILVGIGDGTFQPPLIITDPNVNIPHQQAVADYNGDGFQDLAISQADGNTGLMLIRSGNGNATFQPPVVYLRPPPISVGGGAIVAAHLNGDTRPDIALVRTGAFPAFWVLINSTGVVPPPTPAAPTLLSPTQDARPVQPVAFDWTDVNAAKSYRIQIDDSNNFSTPLVVDQTVTASQFTAAATLAARRHWWRVRGSNSAGVAGAWSSVRRFTPLAAASAPTLSAIALNPAGVVGGNPSQGTATLTSAAPSGGAIVPLSSSNTGVATVPASVTVAAGATSATFTVSTVAVTTSASISISGTFGASARSATLTVVPPAAPAVLSALSVNPTSVTGGTSAQGTVSLTAAAPAGGFAVSLSSSSTASVTVPTSVSVAQGATSTTFAIQTSAVTTSTPVTITASAGGLARTATLTLTPPAQTAALTVTATGRTGERVTSSPAGINVAVGGSGSASFVTGTSIRLSATNSRDVVWSGACSSGGAKTKTCTFTLSGNATVTASVQ